MSFFFKSKFACLLMESVHVINSADATNGCFSSINSACIFVMRLNFLCSGSERLLLLALPDSCICLVLWIKIWLVPTQMSWVRNDVVWMLFFFMMVLWTQVTPAHLLTCWNYSNIFIVNRFPVSCKSTSSMLSICNRKFGPGFCIGCAVWFPNHIWSFMCELGNSF